MGLVFSVFLALTLLIGLSGPASARYNPHWKWRTVTSGDFTVYYPEGHEAFARRVLSQGPEVHRDITGYLGYRPPRLPLVLNPGTDIFNGFFSIFPNRLSLFETPMYSLRGFGSSTSDLVDLVFTHEYTHYTHITTNFGLYHAATRLFGQGIGILNLLSPTWFVEGITTNTETLFTDGGRGRSPDFLGEMRSFTDRGGLWDLASAGTYGAYSPPGSRFYLAGYHMVEYLNRSHGADTFARISRFQGRHPLGFASGAFRKATKESPDTFYRDFLADFNARADSVRAAAHATGLPEGKILKAEDIDGFDSHFWIPDGHIRAVRTGYGLPNAVVEIDPATGATLRELRVGNIYNMAQLRPLPDGRLLYSQPFMHPLGETDLDITDLVVFDPVTGKRSRLTRNAHTFSASASSNGERIAAVARNGMWNDLLLMDGDGKNLHTLVSRAGLFWDLPAWSPDGRTVAAILKEGGDNAIALVDVQSGEIRTIYAPARFGFSAPSYSPDGAWMVFTSDRSGVWNVYARDMNSGKTFRLTAVSYDVEEPRVSPDGRTLSFLSLSRGVKQIRTLPFTPEAGIAEEFVPGGPWTPSAPPDEAGKIAESRGIPLSAYVPYLHIPYGGTDEEGSSLGLLFMGADPVGLNTYSAQALYGLDSNRLGYDASLVNRSFWTDISLRAYDSTLEGNRVGGGNHAWYRERGGELAFSLPVINRIVPDVISSRYMIGARYRTFKGLEKITVDSEYNQSVSLFGEFSISRTPSSPARDLVPGWGQALYAFYETSEKSLGSELPGHNTIAQFTQYAPSPLRHHGFALTVTHQDQGGLLHYDSSGSIPRGYSTDDKEGGFNLDNTLTASLEYHFPIWYADRGVGMTIAHLSLLHGSLFVDHGAGWNGDFRKDTWEHNTRTSFGATLIANTTMAYVVPLNFGVSGGYKPTEEDWFVNAVFGDLFSSLGMKGKTGLGKMRNWRRW